MQQLINEVNTFINSPNHKPRKFRVVRTEFNTYDDVISWAWNEFKLDVFVNATTLEEQHASCDELTNMILRDEELMEEYQLFLQYGPRKKAVVEA